MARDLKKTKESRKKNSEENKSSLKRIGIQFQSLKNISKESVKYIRIHTLQPLLILVKSRYFFEANLEEEV